MVINDLIQSAEGGRTLRQVLEAAYGKKAEEIGVELADINDYERDLDERIIRIYAMFDDRGRATGDVALVAGQTIWQDCETTNIVTSIDEEVEDAFRQTWVRVYPDMDAVFCSNNGRDLTIVNPDRWAERRLYYGADRIDIDDYATTYEDASGNAFEAFQIPWPEVTRILGAKHTGDWEQDQTLIRALRAAGAADWVETFSGGWADEYGWGIIGPAKPESDR